MNLSKDVLTSRSVNATVAGATNINGTILDMSGFSAVRFTCCMGTLTSTQVTELKAQVGNVAGGSDMADLTGAITSQALDADSNKILILDVIMPIGYRYIRPVVVRGTANAVIDSVVADQYKTDDLPVTNGSTISQSKLLIAATPGL